MSPVVLRLIIPQLRGLVRVDPIQDPVRNVLGLVEFLLLSPRQIIHELLENLAEKGPAVGERVSFSIDKPIQINSASRVPDRNPELATPLDRDLRVRELGPGVLFGVDLAEGVLRLREQQVVHDCPLADLRPRLGQQPRPNEIGSVSHPHHVEQGGARESVNGADRHHDHHQDEKERDSFLSVGRGQSQYHVPPPIFTAALRTMCARFEGL